jgi:hypothetical protein
VDKAAKSSHLKFSIILKNCFSWLFTYFYVHKD